MVFLSVWFIVFICLSLLGYHLVIPRKIRKEFILLISIIFHGHFAGAAGVAPIIVLGVFVFFAAKAHEKKLFSNLFPIIVAVPVLALAYYKYSEFFASLLGITLTFRPFVPLAISFFTFEFVHYLVDVRKGKKPISNFLDFWLFVIFFPTIASGPIKRFEQFLPQIRALPNYEMKSIDVSYGVFRFMSGLFKKLIVAEYCIRELAFYTPWFHTNLLDRGDIIRLTLLQTVRIYMDFSGYSDMAIGIARLFGITIPENFNFPYFAKTLSDFWNRWHISLSSWIRDYVYIPLGGGHVSRSRKTFNGLAAMFLCGLWHGPALHFGIWGMYHGAGLALQNRLKITSHVLKLPPLAISILAPVMTFCFVSFGWIIFFYSWEDIRWISSKIFLTT